jgi:uncharacterized protein YggE
MMKKSVFIAAMAVITAGSLVFAAISANKPVEAYAATENGKITVLGYGAISVKPDIAYVSVGVTTQQVDPKSAQSNNAASMDEVLAAIKGLGIEEKDIQTSEYSIYPQQDYQNGNKITGYIVTNMVKVTVRSLDKTAEVLDAAVSAGANAGGGIQFTIADSTAYYEQAMDLAIKNAISKAQAAGKSLKVTVGSPVEIIESSSAYTPTLYGNADMKAVAESVATPIQAGDLSVSAQVTAVFNY